MLVTCSDSCPLCYANARGRANYRGHRGYRRPRPERMVDVGKYLKKPSAPKGSNVPVAQAPDAKFEKAFPALFEFLALTAWEDGSQRVPGTFLAFREDGRWKACLNDREGHRSAFLAASTFDELLTLAEAGLVDGDHEFRAKRENTYQPQRKKA